LGLTDWAFSKAVTSVKYKPYNSSAHLFLRDVLQAGSEGPFQATSPLFPSLPLYKVSEGPFLTTGLLAPTVQIEGALYRVLSPANQATFSSLQFQGTEALGMTHDYTPMFEMPYARVGVMGSIGASEGGKSIQDQQGVAYGGIPGAAFETFGHFYDDRGLAPPSDRSFNGFNGTSNLYRAPAAGKWEPTVQGTLTGSFQYYEEKNTDRYIINQTNQQGPIFLSDFEDDKIRSRIYEAAYYYRFNPQAALLAYYAHRELPVHYTSIQQLNYIFGLTPISQQAMVGATLDQEFNDVQLQSNLLLGHHNLIGGFDYFSSNTSQRLNQTAIITAFNISSTTGFDYQPPYRSTSFYLLDYWRLRQNLVLELGLFKDFNKVARYGYKRTIYTSQWNPSFGADYQFRIRGTLQTLRLALARHLLTHMISQPLLVDPEVASFPWALYVNSGSDIRQAGVAWEAQWNPKTFTALRLSALRVATPDLVTGANNSVYGIWRNWQRYQASMVLNRILTPYLGLSFGVLGKRLIPDLSYQPTPQYPLQTGITGVESYSEFDAFLGLAFLSRQGWLARVRPLLVQQFGKIPGHQAANPFVILNLTLGREFPNKRGFALFEIDNLFNRTPFYSLEPNRILEFSTNRRFIFRLGLYF
jgi:hypothetical protein